MRAIKTLGKSLSTFGGMFALGLVVSAGALGAQTGTLNIYLVDVEGGGATLFVSPSYPTKRNIQP